MCAHNHRSVTFSDQQLTKKITDQDILLQTGEEEFRV